ncbi:peptide methionine sulfoxide reductase [Desulfocurvibacter africanus PCS]|uniref:peptide-methionine (S)-S-oxide reductase n=1 Tax=Desulfocurvibacter africanus PCS TaxID=1262666 RepID=M5Q157_DESAF|nr:peptide methionine sulfoxide reductase [Desulfocurvibacter africanus PCS]
MWRTRVGYAGGSTPDPTYRRIGDHSETLQIEYDPQTIDYAELLRLFWEGHEPTRPAWSRQYASVIFWVDEEERRLAEESLREWNARRGGVYTRVERLEEFHRAEDYHQKYYLRGAAEVMLDFTAIYPAQLGQRAFADSPAAARVNGYLGGYGGPERLARDLALLGLSPRGERYLRRVVERSGGLWR